MPDLVVTDCPCGASTGSGCPTRFGRGLPIPVIVVSGEALRLHRVDIAALPKPIDVDRQLALVAGSLDCRGAVFVFGDGRG
jgi:hypothetical protein